MAISDLRLGAALIGMGLLPFGAATALGQLDSAGGELPCPFREATGLPCPFCGSTRAFALAARGDLGFVEFNAVWVAAAVVAALAGAAVVLTRTVGRRGPPLRSAIGRGPALAAGTGVVLVAWAWAIAQRGTIAG